MYDHKLKFSSFAVSNEDEYEQELKAAKLDDSGVDVNVVWYGESRLKYTMEPVDDFEASDLRKFVLKAQEGEAYILFMR